MSDFEFKPIHKFFKITISSIKYSKKTISPINEVAYRVNNIHQLLDICQSTILDEELSINNIISNEEKTQIFSQKHHISNRHSI